MSIWNTKWVADRLGMQRRREPGGNLSIVVPTLNSESYIDIILQYYSDHGIDIQVFVDDKSTDSTAAVVDRMGFPTHTFGGVRVIEEAIQLIAARAGTEWVLRIDDDELPSLAMIERVRMLTANTADGPDVYNFARWQCAVNARGELIRNHAHSPLYHQQWRLFRAAKVRYTSDIHTPGIIPGDAPLAVHNPVACAMIHLDWAVHSRDSRVEKIARYDAVKEGAGSSSRNYYLIEDDPIAQLYFEPFPAPEFAATARRIRDRFPDLAARFA